jgi:mono/diheme cytochrome c family protein
MRAWFLKSWLSPCFLISTQQYFYSVGIITLTGALAIVLQRPAMTHYILETLGLREPLRAQQDSFYHLRVATVFETYCVSCHGEDKSKGRLRLDDFQQVIFGGKQGSDTHLLIERMLLPASDRKAMPPLGRKRFTDDELAVVKMWVAGGASGSLGSDSFPDAPEPVVEIEFDEIHWDKVAELRAPVIGRVNELQKKYPFAIQFLAQTSAKLRVKSAALETLFTDEDLQALQPISEHIVELDLTGASITDHSNTLLLAMPSLRLLRLAGTRVTEKTTRSLVQLQSLQSLTLNTHMVNKTISSQLRLAGFNVFLVPPNE